MTSTENSGVTFRTAGRTLVADIDSIDALNEFASKPADFVTNRRIFGECQSHRWANSMIGGASKWYGCNTTAECESILKTGRWQQGVDRMSAAMDALTTSAPMSVRRTARWSDQGDSMDIHRVYSGASDQAWRKVGPRRRIATRNISIFFNVTINGGTGTDVLFWRGAAALKLADVLTDAGYNVEIVAIETGRRCSVGFNKFKGQDIVHSCICTTVKHATAPLDLHALAVSLCFSGFLRHLMFKAETALPMHTNLGGAATYREMVSKEYDNRNVILCEDLPTKGAANAWVQYQIDTVERGEQDDTEAA